MLRIAYTTTVVALLAALITVTLLPMTDRQEWWIRAMAFPRIQILIAASSIVFLCFFLAPGLRAAALVLALAP